MLKKLQLLEKLLILCRRCRRRRTAQGLFYGGSGGGSDIGICKTNAIYHIGTKNTKKNAENTELL